MNAFIRDSRNLEKWQTTPKLKTIALLGYAKVLQGVHKFLKCFHNEVSTLKCNSYSYISKYSDQDYSQGILESQSIAHRKQHLKRLRTTA